MSILSRRKRPYLPPIVEPLANALIVESHDLYDIELLREDILELTHDEQVVLHAALLHNGVMRSRFISACAWVSAKRNKSDDKLRAYSFLLSQPKLAPFINKLTGGLLAHMDIGVDYEDEDSIGGFSTRELQFIANLISLVHAARSGCTIPPLGWSCTRTPDHDGPCAAIEEEMTDAGKATM